jgi:small-conductance mechanosensitive channel
MATQAYRRPRDFGGGRGAADPSGGSMTWRTFGGLFGVVVMLLVTSALAQEPSPPAETPPAKVRELVDLLSDPAVREWLERQRTSDVVIPTPPAAEEAPTSYLATRLSAIRQHIKGLVSALPTLPEEFERAGANLSRELQETGLLRTILLIGVFVLLGFGVERLYRLAAGRERWVEAQTLDTMASRLRGAAIRLAYGIGLVVAFAIGSVGAFLAFEWPPLLRDIGFGYLLAFVILRLTIVLSRFLLAPGVERLRIVPMTTTAARYWHRRLTLIVGWLAFGSVTVGVLSTLGFTPSARAAVAYILGLGLLAIGLEIAWRRPMPPSDAAPAGTRTGLQRASRWLLSVYFLLLWLLWVISATPAFWLAVIALALPLALRTTSRSVNNLLWPAGAADAGGQSSGLTVVALERGLRALLIIGAVLLLARAWHINPAALTEGDTVGTRLLRGALNAIVIIFVADFLLRSVRVVIDRSLARARAGASADAAAQRRRARMQTLLPILRNVILVVIGVMAVLMVLAALGVDIAPLVAGAGVVGVAIGFGAQTVVKDVLSGVFYMLDDSFRVGEYIQSGDYKGTVESFSLRSVKLRHHRGPLTTVPFGELGAVQNLSRDWVIDKMAISVTYDSDIDKAKALIKKIGKDLAADPEFAPHILEPMKMQGVEQFGDFGITIRMKMMTKPGEQFPIRRRAFALIKKAFDANGIKFARPTVNVAGGAESEAAGAAQQAVAMAKAAAQTP